MDNYFKIIFFLYNNYNGTNELNYSLGKGNKNWEWEWN